MVTRRLIGAFGAAVCMIAAIAAPAFTRGAEVAFNPVVADVVTVAATVGYLVIALALIVEAWPTAFRVSRLTRASLLAAIFLAAFVASMLLGFPPGLTGLMVAAACALAFGLLLWGSDTVEYALRPFPPVERSTA